MAANARTQTETHHHSIVIITQRNKSIMNGKSLKRLTYEMPQRDSAV